MRLCVLLFSAAECHGGSGMVVWEALQVGLTKAVASPGSYTDDDWPNSQK